MRKLFFLLLLPFLLCAEGFYLPQSVEKQLRKEYSHEAVLRANALVALMNKLEKESLKNKLVEVNDFFNQIPYKSDSQVWDKSDYWANRVEFIGKGMGDCEDYTYAKYFTLIQLGIDRTQLRAFYCQSLTYKQAHMVLAFFSPKKRVPFILGNYNYKVLPSTQREDLKLIKVYNSDDLFLAKLKKHGVKVPQEKDKALEWLTIINGIRSKE